MILETLSNLPVIDQDVLKLGVDTIDYYLYLVSQLATHPESALAVGSSLAVIDELVGAFSGEETVFSSGDLSFGDRLKRFSGVAIRESLPVYLGANMVDNSLGNSDIKSYIDYGLGTALLVMGVIPDRAIKPVFQAVLGITSLLTENLADSVKGSRRGR